MHEDEVEKETELAWLADSRARAHAQNVIKLIFTPEKLEREAGTGKREGFKDAGPLVL